MYQKITTVNISLTTSGVSRASFGIPMFISGHAWFAERSRTYTDMIGVAADVPVDSAAYAAAQSAFSQDVPPAQIKLGRRSLSDITLTPDTTTTIGQVFSITVVDADGTETVASFTSQSGAEAPAAIVDDLVTDLGASADAAATDNGDTFSLSRVGSPEFTVKDIVGMSYVNTATESAAATIAALSNENDDYYFVAAEDHSTAYVLAMATDIEARNKIYFVAVQEDTNLDAYSDTAVDTLAQLKQAGRDRTSGWYHHTADTTFPEMEYISILATADPGTMVVGDNTVSSVAAKNVTTGLPLSATEKGNLVDKSANFTEVEGGINITRQGTVASGKWIDEVRDRDYAANETSVALRNMLINTPKLPYTDSGINKVRNVLASTYNRMVSTETQPNILQNVDPFVINLPRRKDVSFSDITARTLKGTVTLYLSGAILVININGTATYDAV